MILVDGHNAMERGLDRVAVRRCRFVTVKWQGRNVQTRLPDADIDVNTSSPLTYSPKFLTGDSCSYRDLSSTATAQVNSNWSMLIHEEESS